jgi:hypothetical protein
MVPQIAIVDDPKYSFVGLLCQPRLRVARGVQSALNIRGSRYETCKSLH